MTHEVAPSHELNYRSDFCNPLLIEGVRVINDHAKGGLSSISSE